MERSNKENKRKGERERKKVLLVLGALLLLHLGEVKRLQRTGRGVGRRGRVGRGRGRSAEFVHVNLGQGFAGLRGRLGERSLSRCHVLLSWHLLLLDLLLGLLLTRCLLLRTCCLLLLCLLLLCPSLPFSSFSHVLLCLVFTRVRIVGDQVLLLLAGRLLGYAEGIVGVPGDVGCGEDVRRGRVGEGDLAGVVILIGHCFVQEIGV